MQTITLTPHEQSEYRRCATAMYARGATEKGHVVSAALAKMTLPIQQYDRASAIYRDWLIFDEPKS